MVQAGQVLVCSGLLNVPRQLPRGAYATGLAIYATGLAIQATGLRPVVP
jgi:hypothetical protein